MLHEPHGMPTFMIEALRLIHDVQRLNRLILLNEWHYLSTVALLVAPCNDKHVT